MLKALIEGDIKLFEKMLRKVVLAVFSYHDFGGEPEKVYHALVAGLSSGFPTPMRSNPTGNPATADTIS
jgi:hypothetical protein